MLLSSTSWFVKLVIELSTFAATAMTSLALCNTGILLGSGTTVTASFGEGLIASSKEPNKAWAKPSSTPKNESWRGTCVTSTSFEVSFGVSFGASLAASFVASFVASFGASLGVGLGASLVLFITWTWSKNCLRSLSDFLRLANQAVSKGWGRLIWSARSFKTKGSLMAIACFTEISLA